jgi:hypothetical protein
MENDMGTALLKELRAIAIIPVIMDVRVNANEQAIVVSSTRLNEMMRYYRGLCMVVRKCWSNLPPAPVSECSHVVMWMIACENYGVNHSTIRWDGANLNTFVHLWSIMDRIKPTLSSMDLGWLMGSRSCVEYCLKSGAEGPMDSYMYSKERVPPEQLTNMLANREALRYKHLGKQFDSFYDMMRSTRVPKPVITLNLSRMILDRDAKVSSASTTTCTQSGSGP